MKKIAVLVSQPNKVVVTTQNVIKLVKQPDITKIINLG